MKKLRTTLTALCFLPVLGTAFAETHDDLVAQVRAAETAFAQTMASRDLEAFGSMLADESVFFGSRGAMRGAAAVQDAWQRFFEDEAAPFSWEPEVVEVLASGTLALTSGPVHDSEGGRIGTFNSIWRREADGRWKVIFDRGCPPCECPKGP